MVFTAILSFFAICLQAQTATKTLKLFAPPSGATTDSILLWRGDSTVRKINSSLISVEPWNVATTSNKATGNTQDIYQNGKVGIGNFGTAAPAASLDIETGGTSTKPNPTGFKLVDGNQNSGKVLVSDANGVGTWQVNGITYTRGGLGASGVNIPFGTGGNLYTGDSIILPPGTWQVNVQMLMTASGVTAGNTVWEQTTFCDTKTTYAFSADIQGNSHFISGRYTANSVGAIGIWSMLSGFLIIKNSGTAPKTYYYWVAACIFSNTISGATISAFGNSSSGENLILAQPVTF